MEETVFYQHPTEECYIGIKYVDGVPVRVKLPYGGIFNIPKLNDCECILRGEIYYRERSIFSE